MPPKRRSVKLPFPVKGLNESYGYEDQPDGTTVDAQNVRSFPAKSADPSSGDSKASGRARGGQRPGLSKYVSTAHSSDTSIQNISHMAYSEFTPLAGRGHSVIREDTGGSFTIIDNAGAIVATLGVVTETYNLGQWGRDGFVYTACVDASHKLIMRKHNSIGTKQWDWIDAGSPSVQLVSATRQVVGMTVFGDYVYVWVRNITDSFAGEAIYRVKTSDGNLRDAISGAGTEADYWIRSEDQTTNAFKDFYPSSGETGQVINPMMAGNGMLTMACYNDSGATADESTKSNVINYDDDAEAVRDAIIGMTHLTADNVTVAGGDLNTTTPMTITFADNLATQDVAVFERTDFGAYTTGTIEYDHTGSANEFEVTLSGVGAEWPAWAATGVITILGVEYTVDARISTTILTLDSSSNPGADVAASTAYSLADGVFSMTTARGDKDNSTVVSITWTGSVTERTFKLAHDGRISVQAINIENGKQMFCREVQEAGNQTGANAYDSQSELDIAMDEVGNIFTLTRSKKGTSSYSYAVAKTASDGSKVAAFGAAIGTSIVNGTVENTGVHRAMCYDFIGRRLAVVGGNVSGTSHSFATVNATTGAVINSQDANGDNNWNSVYQDEKGGFRLFQNTATDCCIRMTEAVTPAYDWTISPALQGDNLQTGAACAAFYAFNPQNSLAVRQTKQLAVAGGVVKEFDSLQWYDLASGGGTTGNPSLAPDRDVIFSAQLGSRLYFADGINEKYYDPSDGELKAWTTSAGTLPQDNKGRKPTLIENWRDRIVMAGVLGDPHEYYMSKSGDATDWNYTPTTVTNTQATSGVNSPAGRSPDVIRAIIPLNDDVLIWGCDQSIWAMTGDPMEEGRIDNIVDGVGMPWGRPWCKDMTGSFYFFGSKGGVYRGAVGQGIQKITVGSIEERMNDIDLDKNIIRLLWNERDQGVHVYVTPLNSYTATTHYFYDIRANAWWLDKFEATSSNQYIHNPKEVHVFDGLDPDDRVVLMGGWDGFVRKWDLSSSNDDGNAIDSYVYFGPLVSENLGLIKLKELRVQLGKNSSNVTASVFTGDNAEDAYAQTSAHFTSTFTAGRNVSERRRATSHAMYLKMGNNTVDQRWTLERAEADIALTARKFARIY